MTRDEYMQELMAAYDAMDDRARDRQRRQFKRAAVDFPREVARPERPTGLRLAAVSNQVPRAPRVGRAVSWASAVVGQEECQPLRVSGASLE